MRGRVGAWAVVILSTIASMWGPNVSADDAPPEMIDGYRTFLNAVWDQDEKGIRNCLMPDAAAPAFRDLVAEQLMTFREFELAVARRLGPRERMGFGLSDADLNRRLAAVPRGMVAKGRLKLPTEGTSPSPLLGFDWLGVGMTFDGTAWKVDALGDAKGGAAGYLKSSETPGGPPGRRVLEVYRSATAELDAGRITSRAALEQFIEQGLARADEAAERRLDAGRTVADDAETVRARDVVRAWLMALKAFDEPAMKRVMASTDPEGAAVVARVAERLAIVVHLDVATHKAGVNSLQLTMGDLIDRTLARLPTACLLVEGDRGVLRSTIYSRFVATSRPLTQSGFFGPLPEAFQLLRVGGEWRVAAEPAVAVGVGAKHFMTRLHDRGTGNEVAEFKALIAAVERHDFLIERQFLNAYEHMAQRVKVAAEGADDQPADAAAERVRRLEAWRKSPEGRAALERMTAKTSRLQIRLVLRAGEEGEADELPDPSGQKLRVSREILLNETAFASAIKGAGPSNGSPIVLAKLNEAGANQMEWVTSRNLDRRIAIVFDGKVLMAPTIRSTIRGALTIDGGANGFAAGEIERIVAALNGAK